MAARTVSRRSRDLVALGSLTAWAICAQAQEKPREPTKPDDKLQEVVITGSRIARPDLDRLEPTTVVKGELFDERGYTDVGQALQELPAFGIQPSSAVNQQNGFGIAQSFVDLYSLGSQRTLTLINGRRFVSSSTATLFNGATSPGQQVDLNVVPTKLIDRIETVSVGGAPIYGADAIAGTVNIILKKNFQGLDLDAQTGVSNRKDGWNHRFRALGGLNFADGRGNITGVAEFNKNDGLIGPRRANVANDLGFDAPLNPGPFKTVLTPNGSIPAVSTSGIPLVDDVFYGPAFGLTPQMFGVNNASGQPLAWSPGSSALKPFNLGTQTGNPVFFQGGDGVRLSQFTNLLAPQKRVNLDTLGNFKFTDHFAAFAEGWFSEEHATNLINQPAYNTAFFQGAAGSLTGNFLMSINNPFLSAADRAAIQSALNAYGASVPAANRVDPNWDGSHFYVSRANTDLQSGAAVVDQVVSRGVLGVNGDFALGTRSYNWEIAGNYGYSRDTNHTPSYVFQNLLNALNATRDASGNIVCAGNPVNSPIATGSPACAPLNIFGQGSPSAAAVQYITHNALARSIDTQRDVTANMNGDVVKLPAGEWKAAIGYENRRETAKFEPDSYYTTGAGQAAASPVSGGYHTNEFYGETLIPIFEPLQAIPALHQLELEGAVRRVNNSIAGNSTTWTKGLRWSPIQDVQFRGNKTHSIRAPAVTELFLPPSTAFEFANDPCDKNFVGQGNAPATRAKNCAAAGINTSTFVSTVVNGTAQGITSGNVGLTSETAESRTYGVVLRPRFIPRLNLSVDFVEINLSNAIEQLNLVALLDACYDSTNYPNDPSCSQFTRNAAHQITSFQDGFVNAGLLDFSGVTFGADWSVRMPGRWGGLELRANWLDTHKLLQKIGSASANSLVGELGTTFAAPHGKGVIDVNYRNGGFEWYWQGLYTGPFNFDNKDTATTKDILGVSHWWLVNTTIGYEFTRSFETRLIIDNVANKEPPFPALAAIGGNFASPTSLYWSGIIGRTYLLSAAYHF
jgi:iron complex outermembrane receptor protein